MRGGCEQCPNCLRSQMYLDGGQEYSRAILVEVPGVYDGGLYWQCGYEDCGHCWQRWPSSSRLYATAAPFIHEENLAARRELTSRLLAGLRRLDATHTDPERESPAGNQPPETPGPLPPRTTGPSGDQFWCP